MVPFKCDTLYLKVRNLHSNETIQVISCVAIGLMFVFNYDGKFVKNLMKHFRVTNVYSREEF